MWFIYNWNWHFVLLIWWTLRNGVLYYHSTLHTRIMSCNELYFDNFTIYSDKEIFSVVDSHCNIKQKSFCMGNDDDLYKTSLCSIFLRLQKPWLLMLSKYLDACDFITVALKSILSLNDIVPSLAILFWTTCRYISQSNQCLEIYTTGKCISWIESWN